MYVIGAVPQQKGAYARHSQADSGEVVNSSAT